MTMRVVFACCVGLLLTLQGCSYLFVSAPPADHAQRAYFACTTSRLGPGLDATLAVLQGTTALASLMTDVTDSDDRLTLVGVSAAIGALYAASAVHGFDNVNECDAALAAASTRRDAMQRVEPWHGATATPLAPPPANIPTTSAPESTPPTEAPVLLFEFNPAPPSPPTPPPETQPSAAPTQSN